MTDRDHAKRLAALRAELARDDLAAVLVPRADERQGEYVAPCDERLAYVSGFTGSAGLALVGRERAAIFVDGRYTIQVRGEAPAALWEHRHVLDAPPEAWAKANLQAGDRVGFDPRLHTPEAVGRLEKALGALGIRLVPTDGNLVDRIWSDRPPEPMASAELWPEELAGESAAEKRRRIAEKLADERLDALVVTAPDNLAWAFNLRGGDVAMLPVAFGTAIFRADGAATLFLAPEKLDGETRKGLAADGAVELRSPAEMPEVIAGLGGRRVRLDRATANLATLRALEAAGATADVGADPISLMKAQKNEAELAGMRAAHRRDAAALTRFLAWFDAADPEALDEWTAAERLEAFRSDANLYRGPSFPTIAAFGANAAQAHYHADARSAARLSRDALFLVDSGAQYLDGTTDVTRVLVTGTPTAEARRRYTQVLKGHLAVSRARFPQGVTGAQIDSLARQFLWDAGTDFDHGTGHGVGCYLSVHEGPQSLSKRGTETPLLPGMVVSNEPGYYKADGFGIRIENLLAVVEADPQPDGAERPTLAFETLTFAPYERRLIDVPLLTGEERRLVDEYHAQVRAVLGDAGLDAETREWLDRATAPLGD